MDRLGKMVRIAREKYGHTLKGLASAGDCSEAFARHIESSPTVPVSDRIVKNLIKAYRLPARAVARAAAVRRRTGTKYVRGYYLRQKKSKRPSGRKSSPSAPRSRRRNPG